MDKDPVPYQETPPPHPGAPPRHAIRSAMPVNNPARRPVTNTTGSQPRKLKSPFTANAFATDKRSARRMLMLAVAFLIFYVLIVASKLIVDYNSTQQRAKNEHLSYSNAVATRISTEIENTVIWINNGLSEGQTPAAAARLIAKSPVVSVATIVNLQGKTIATYPRQSQILDNIPVQNVNAGMVKLNSVIQPDGRVIPLVVKRTGQYFVVAALSDTVLVSENNTIGVLTVVAPSGRVISGDKAMGRSGPRDAYNLTDAQFSALTQPGSNTVRKIKMSGNKHLLSSVQIPNTDLFLFGSKTQLNTSVLQNNLTLFFILFVGTCALVWTLLHSLTKQLRVVQGVQHTTEVSQQRYQAAVEGDRGGVWEVDLAGSSAFVSGSLAGLLGLLRKEQTMPLSRFLNLFHPDDRERFLAFARRAHLQGEFDFDIRVAHLPLTLQCRGRSSVRSGHEMKRVIVGVALDITEQRAAQMRLKITESRLHDALSSMTDSFVVWDSAGRLVVWNNKFMDFFGFKPGALYEGLEHISVDYLAQAAVHEKYEYERVDERWIEYQLKDGRWIRYTETPTAEGGHVSIGTDITKIRLHEADLKNNEQALKNTVDVLRKSQDSIVELAERYESEKIRAEEASQSKTNFLASMSHELRTPLNAINGFSDIMQKEMFGPLGDPRYKDYVNDILFSGQHLLSLINDILDMSKIEAGKMTLNTEVMFVHEMLAQVVRMVRGKADDGGLKLQVDVIEVREIEADPRSIKQILLNLLTNAIKFTPEGGTVGVELIQKQSGIIVKVYDTGIGISQENIDKLAKPFEQVDDQANRQNEGTGLGLALSKSFVELHGGKFKIESVIGKGTTVIFSLPNKPITPAKENEAEDVSQEIFKLKEDIASILGQTESLPRHATKTTAPPPYPGIGNHQVQPQGEEYEAYITPNKQGRPAA